MIITNTTTITTTERNTTMFRTNEIGEPVDPGGPRYIAKCTCGWTSARRINPNDVKTLISNHVERAHPHRRDFRQTDPMEVTR